MSHKTLENKPFRRSSSGRLPAPHLYDRLYLTPSESATWQRIKADPVQSETFKRRIFRRRGENQIFAQSELNRYGLELGDLAVKARAVKKTAWWVRLFDWV
jgi:hypothetical protein